LESTDCKITKVQLENLILQVQLDCKSDNVLTCYSSDEKIECFTISLAPVRAEIDLQNRRYWDALASSLQTSILGEVTTIDKFITESTDALSKQPRSVDEISEAKSAYTQIIKNSAKASLEIINKV
jgi:dynein heavy chain 2